MQRFLVRTVYLLLATAFLSLFFLCLFINYRSVAWANASVPSLEHMVGQMLLCGFRGTGETPLSEDLVCLLEDIKAGRIGGVIYFDRDALLKTAGRNIVSFEQVRNLSALLQKEAPHPLFIGIDQEGGKVQRLRSEHGGIDTPSASLLGQGDTTETFATAARLGKVLHQAGINLNFAPSLDVNVDPQSPAIGLIGRSFSDNPLMVAQHGKAFAQGLASENILPCYKHFPGHGSAKTDTHLGLADITESWSEAELIPYELLLPESVPAMVMPGHIVHRKKGGDLPASLSPAIISGILRQKLGWKGVVITDDLQMEAVEGWFTTKEALRLAIVAGADILLLGNNLRHDPQEARKAHALVMELVREGALSQERIRESYETIKKLKIEAGLW